MKFQTYEPCDMLKPFVKAFAIQEVAEERLYKVFPGTGLVIGFQYQGLLSYMEGNKEIPLATSGITGLQDQFRIFKNGKQIASVLVYFKDGGAAAFLKTPVNNLFRESLSLDHFFLRSELIELEEKLSGHVTDKERIGIVENFLLTNLKYIKPDKLVSAAIAEIYRNNGCVKVSELCDFLNTSISPLEKKFRSIVGASPKKFASIVRIKNIIENNHSKENLTRLTYEAGFYDQAHFIKAFKRYTGLTPEYFFST